MPKRLALHNPERIACAVAAPMRAISVIASPAVHLLSASTDAVLRILGIRQVAEQPVTEEEIKILIEFKEIFHKRKLPGEGSYQTLGGFVLMQMGRIPSVGNHFEWGGLRFEVVDMDGNRVDKVLVMPVRKAQQTSLDG